MRVALGLTTHQIEKPPLGWLGRKYGWWSLLVRVALGLLPFATDAHPVRHPVLLCLIHDVSANKLDLFHRLIFIGCTMSYRVLIFNTDSYVKVTLWQEIHQ